MSVRGEAWKACFQGQVQEGGGMKTSADEELWQFEKSEIWKYYRKAGFQIKRPFFTLLRCSAHWALVI